MPQNELNFIKKKKSFDSIHGEKIPKKKDATAATKQTK